MTDDFKWDFDWKSTILSQYSRTYLKDVVDEETGEVTQEKVPTVICKLIKGISELLDPTPDFKVVYDNIINPETCSGKGIEIWSRIVAMSNTQGIEAEVGTFFGFQDSMLTPFDNSPFVYDTVGSKRFLFTDASMKTLMQSKALANIGRASLPVLKTFLKTILGSDQFAVDNDQNTISSGGVMAVKFLISGTKDVTMQLFKLYVPKVIGAGVKVYYQVTGSSFFGFDGQDIAAPFDVGAFYNDESAGWAYGSV